MIGSTLPWMEAHGTAELAGRRRQGGREGAGVTQSHTHQALIHTVHEGGRHASAWLVRSSERRDIVNEWSGLLHAHAVIW